MESDTQSVVAENKFYKTSDHFFTKRENLFKTCSLEQKYNLKAVTRRDHESHMGSPCRSIFTFILMSRRRDLSLVSTFLVSLLSILLRRKTYF